MLGETKRERGSAGLTTETWTAISSRRHTRKQTAAEFRGREGGGREKRRQRQKTEQAAGKEDWVFRVGAAVPALGITWVLVQGGGQRSTKIDKNNFSPASAPRRPRHRDRSWPHRGRDEAAHRGSRRREHRRARRRRRRRFLPLPTRAPPPAAERPRPRPRPPVPVTTTGCWPRGRTPVAS